MQHALRQTVHLIQNKAQEVDSASNELSSVNPHTTGTGIGLAIVRRIVESVDGHISCHSTPTGGCRFSFDLPAA